MSLANAGVPSFMASSRVALARRGQHEDASRREQFVDRQRRQETRYALETRPQRVATTSWMPREMRGGPYARMPHRGMEHVQKGIDESFYVFQSGRLETAHGHVWHLG
jgi:hypothetical protein